MPTKEELARVIFEAIAEQVYTQEVDDDLRFVIIDGTCNFFEVAESVLASLADRTP